MELPPTAGPCFKVVTAPTLEDSESDGTPSDGGGSLPGVQDPSRPDKALERARHVGWILMGRQLVATVAFSTFEYRRFALSTDFGAYSQAWWKIAHGQLDPTSTVLATAFWKNDAEFVMWPLSLLAQLDPHPVVLLWIQDLAVVATELVAFGWIIDVTGRSSARLPAPGTTALTVGAAVVVVLNPWVYETIAFDFHTEVLAALFVVLIGRDLWRGRTRRLWWWVVPGLLCSVMSGLYLIGVGISGLVAGRSTRRTGIVLASWDSPGSFSSARWGPQGSAVA